jgi:hypothetical protein
MSYKIKVVNKKTHVALPNEVDFYIGRGSPLGNPYDWRGSKHPDVKYQVRDRAAAISSYRDYLEFEINDGNPKICDEINKLVTLKFQGKTTNLVCYCCPDACHGDFIKEVVSNLKYCVNWFSNMRTMDVPIKQNGNNFWSVENFYQAMKTIDPVERAKIASMSPHKSKTYARTIPLREDWEAIKEAVMYLGLKKKFAPNTRLGERLKTYEGPIVEWNNWGDKSWGRCIYTNEGENKLGWMLESIRKELNEKTN